MARKRVEPVPALGSWDAVNLALAEIGEHQRVVETVAATMQETIDDVKLAADMEAAPHQKRIAELEGQIKQFVDVHAGDLGNKRSKALTFGTVGYRKSTRVVLPRAAAKIKEIITQLHARGMSDCVIEPQPRVDKDALKKYPPSDIIAVGAKLATVDAFWYEYDRERLAKEA